MAETIQLPAGGNERLRVSAWSDPIFFANTIIKKVKDAKGKEKDAVFLDPSKPTFRADSALPGKGVLDDVCLLSTFRTDEQMTFVWDTDGFLPSSSNTQRQQFANNIIDECHAKGIQCLVGFSLMALGQPPGPKFSAFNNW